MWCLGTALAPCWHQAVLGMELDLGELSGFSGSPLTDSKEQSTLCPRWEERQGHPQPWVPGCSGRGTGWLDTHGPGARSGFIPPTDSCPQSSDLQPQHATALGLGGKGLGPENTPRMRKGSPCALSAGQHTACRSSHVANSQGRASTEGGMCGMRSPC